MTPILIVDITQSLPNQVCYNEIIYELDEFAFLFPTLTYDSDNPFTYEAWNGEQTLDIVRLINGVEVMTSSLRNIKAFRYRYNSKEERVIYKKVIYSLTEFEFFFPNVEIDKEIFVYHRPN